MNLKNVRKEELDINITPLIDVVFLLLIFFMVSTTFKHESEITIDLPEATAKQPKRDKKLIEISIDKKGTYYVEHQQVVNTKLETLKRALKKVSGNRKGIIVLISADAYTPHQFVVRAMDASRQVGLVNLSIATKRYKSDTQ